MTLIREILMLLAGLLAAAQPLEEPPRVQSAPPPAPILVPVTLAELLPRDQVFELAFDVSGSEAWAAEAVAVAHCESRFDPSALGAAGEEGMFQVRAIYHGHVPESPRGQVAQAFEVWSEHGWGIWSCRP